MSLHAHPYKTEVVDHIRHPFPRTAVEPACVNMVHFVADKYVCASSAEDPGCDHLKSWQVPVFHNKHDLTHRASTIIFGVDIRSRRDDLAQGVEHCCEMNGSACVWYQTSDVIAHNMRHANAPLFSDSGRKQDFCIRMARLQFNRVIARLFGSGTAFHAVNGPVLQLPRYRHEYGFPGVFQRSLLLVNRVSRSTIQYISFLATHS